MIVVPRVNTPLDKRTFPARIHAAFAALGTNLTPTQAANLASLVCLETGSGKSVQNFSPGNISADERFEGKVWRPPWFEAPTASTSARNRHLHAEMKAGRAPAAFRAYDSEELGWSDFAVFLKRRFPNVIEAANDLNSDSFRRALAQSYSKDYADPRHTATLRTLMAGYGFKTHGAASGGVAAVAILAALFFL